MINNQIYCGDNVELCKKIDDNVIDFVITSPPYDNLRKYNGFTWDFENLVKELYRIIKPGGVIIWVVGDSTINGSETGTSFKQALYFKEMGFNLHDTMIYRSKKPPLTHNRYEQEFEYMFAFSKGKPKTFNPIKVPTIYGGCRSDRPKSDKGSRSQNCAIRSRNSEPRFVKDFKIAGNIFEYKTGGGNSTKDKIAFKRPAIFPEELVKDQINTWTKEHDLILDPFMGSGTVAKMAKLLNRDYLGFEISQEYIDIANARLSLLESN